MEYSLYTIVRPDPLNFGVYRETPKFSVLQSVEENKHRIHSRVDQLN